MSIREKQLEAPLRANTALRVQAERLIAAYVAPESDRAAIIDQLITLFDGRAQREARGLASEAMAEDRRMVWWLCLLALLALIGVSGCPAPGPEPPLETAYSGVGSQVLDKNVL
jgi:hypothetical protein